MVPLFHSGRRKRTYLSLLVAVILAGCMFLAFQLFSYEALDADSSKMEHRQRKQWEIKNMKPEIHHRVVKEEIGSISDLKDCMKQPHLCKKNMDNGEKGNHERKQYHRGGKYESLNPHINTNNQKTVAVGVTDGKSEEKKYVKNRKFVKVPSEKIPRGVLRSEAYLYLPNDQTLFQCHNSDKQIPISRVNDDYCDCPDSSDEPGTAACPSGRFYCTFQLWDLEPAFFPASRVNDGICDCCDGSDEWSSQWSPDDHRIPDKRKQVGVKLVPCQDNCDDLRKKKAEREHLYREGGKLKEKYIAAARGIDNKNGLFGVDGVFYLLSTQCFSIDVKEYTYKVCPFKEISQVKSDSSTLLGDESSWISQHKSNYKLRMARGQSKGCPGAIERSSLVLFKCGLQDKLIQAREDEICKYEFAISTPAAC